MSSILFNKIEVRCAPDTSERRAVLLANVALTQYCQYENEKGTEVRASQLLFARNNHDLFSCAGPKIRLLRLPLTEQECASLQSMCRVAS